ncbi:MAG: hypothetical protein KAG66_23380, partial [Methylococcales bacterium]|nr:hypothetical protein [Methylococcales bacterium]
VTQPWLHRFSVIHVDADFPASERASDHDPVRVRFGDCTLMTGIISEPIITQSGSNVVVDWLGNPGNFDYDVYRSTSPYTLGSVVETVAAGGGSYTHSAGTGNAGINYYYTVRANNCADAMPIDTDQTGEFDYLIEPGT